MLTILANIVSIAIALVVSLRVWRYRHEPEVKPYLVFMLGQMVWGGGYVCEIAAPGLAAKVFWDNVQYIGTALMMISMLIFSLSYSGIRFRGMALFYATCAVPIAIFVYEVFRHPLGPVARPNARLVAGGLNGALIYDISMYLDALFVYALLIYAVTVLALSTRLILGHTLYFFQSLSILLGTLVPMVGIALTVTVIKDAPFRDLTPLTFSICNLLVGLGLFYFRLFDIVPFARNVLFQNLTDGVVVLDSRNRVCDFNGAARAFSGDTGLHVGEPLTDALPHVALPESAAAELPETHQETVVEGRHIDVRLIPVRDPRGVKEGMLAVLRDVTDKKRDEEELRAHRDNLEMLVRERTEQLHKELAARQRLEEQFRQAQKMEAVGRLAGGVAHDFNNLLTAIMGNAELLSMDLGDDERAREPISIIRSVAAQAAGLTQQLLAFSRKQVLQPKVILVNEVLKGMEKMLVRLVGEDVVLCLELDPGLDAVKADPVQLQQVIMNLVINARDAMPNGGRLTLSTANTAVHADDEGLFSDVVPGPYVLLRVADTGTGMSHETMSRIFEPFFTTKIQGKGTGLGLAMVHGIVRQSGGTINVESREGQGSTFSILLPRFETSETEEPEAAPPADTDRLGGETVLVLEDDVSVLNLVRRVLTRAGYRVLESADANGALNSAKGYMGRIDLLLTDVVLTGTMTGTDLAEEVVALRPGIKTLFMSGYTGDKAAVHGVLASGVNFIAKPFSPAELLERVGMLLGRGEAGVKRDGGLHQA